MASDKWTVRVKNGKREHWDTVPASAETDARMTAANVTDVNKPWQAFVRNNGATVAKYKRGLPVKTRKAVSRGP